VAAFPSLHVAFPFLTFLALRRAFGRIGWLAFGYTMLVAFSVLYTGDHWLVDVVAGIAYAYVAFYLVVASPPWVRIRSEAAWDRLTSLFARHRVARHEPPHRERAGWDSNPRPRD
jgi:membrane-associated phospholipid phosphatase